MKTPRILLVISLFSLGSLLVGSGGCSSSSSGTASTTGGAGGSAEVPQTCAEYCTEIMANCTGAEAQYSDLAHCTATCATFADLGTAADTSGNTLGCRIYHAGAPAKMDPKTHCQHAGPSGAGTCGTECDGFCQIAVKDCSTQYATSAACQTACAAFKSDSKPFSIAETAGDSVNCRVYHATAATVDPKTHCPHIVAASAVCK